MKKIGGAPLLQLALVALGLLTAAPLLWMVSASFMHPGDSSTFPPPLWPARPTLENYIALFTRLQLAGNFMNSVLIAVVGTASSVLVNAMAGYAFAKLRFKGRDRLFQLLLVALVVPTQVGMLPLFLELKAMGLVNTPLGVMIPYLSSVFGIFMVRQYALGIPDDLLDAARIDGAGEHRIFFGIVLPVIRPILVTLALFSFLSAWNDFLWPLIVLSDSSRFTLPVALASLAGEHIQDAELMMAGAVVTVLPVIVMFLLLQRFYTEGVMRGSLKG